MEAVLKRFIDNPANTDDPKTRKQYGVFAGGAGICVNLLLFAAKLAIGLLSGALSIVADAVNNLSDAGSAIVMLLGFRIAAQPADPEHPFGHGRVEYLAGLFVAAVIIVVGVELFRDSIDKISNPQALAVDAVTLGVLALSIAVKLALSRFYQSIADRISSPAIAATAADSRNDCLTTFVVLLAMIIYDFYGFNIDGAAGLFVAVFIIYSGAVAAWETVQPLLGEAPDPELVEDIKAEVMQTNGVLGVHDIIVHNYGPGRIFVSLHAEMPAGLKMLKAHTIIDELEQRLEEKFRLAVTVHLDPIVTDDPELDHLRGVVEGILRETDEALSMHDFRLTHSAKGGRTLIFDVAVPHDCRYSDRELHQEIMRRIRMIDDNYQGVIHFDHQYC